MKTQKEIVKDYLLEGKKISQRKAIAYFNIIRLGAIIYTLKKEGMNIETYLKPNVYNNSRYAEYSLKNNEEKYA